MTACSCLLMAVLRTPGGPVRRVRPGTGSDLNSLMRRSAVPAFAYLRRRDVLAQGHEEFDAEQVSVTRAILDFLGLEPPADHEIVVRHRRLADGFNLRGSTGPVRGGPAGAAVSTA